MSALHGARKMPAKRDRSIHQAIGEVLRAAGRSMTADEIYSEIIRQALYEFRARKPLDVVKTQLRRHCKDVDFPTAHRRKYFGLDSDGRYTVLPAPVTVAPTLYTLKGIGRARSTVVTVPDPEPDDVGGDPAPTHSDVQWRLLDLGSRMGLSVWAPMADRGRCSADGKRLADVPRLLKALPQQFDSGTSETIRNIDVLWLDRHAIIAGFEIEHTSTIYSGLLRMSDLLTAQPNIEITLYLVAPDERFAKFAKQVARPTFARLRKPLHTMCRFLPYTKLFAQLAAADNLITHLRPEFLQDIAESYDPVAEAGPADDS